MKKVKLNGGFTIIELLVGLNLAFILITLLVSFYLFSARFVNATSRNLDSREMLLSSVAKFQNLIKIREGFTVKRTFDNEIVFIFTPRDTVILRQDSFRVSDLCLTSKIDNFSLGIFMTDGKEHLFSSNSALREGIPEEGYTSKDIDAFMLSIKMKGHEYTFHIIKNRTSENSFKDIEK